MLVLSSKSHLLAVCIIFATLLGVISSPLPLTPKLNASSEELEQRDNHVYPGRYRNLPIKLMRKTKEGSVISKPDTTKVTAGEEWTLFIGPDGFHARPGPFETLTAQQVPVPRSPLGMMIPNLQDLGEKATFSSAEARDEVFKKLLTDIPALHKGVGVPQTNLAYLNGIFAYLASSTVKAVSTPKPPEAWMKMYNEMYAAKGNA